MKEPFIFSAEQLKSELEEINERLAAGFQAMSRYTEIETGVSARDAVYEDDIVTLYRYRPVTQTSHHTPLLIVYALVNRPYMADLEDGRSLIQGLIRQGIDVYLLDWGYPDRAHTDLGLDDYINGYLDTAVDSIRSRHELERINILGICQGGTLTLCYSCLHQHKIGNIITSVTPVDFRTDRDLLSHLVQGVDIDLCVRAMGNIPGEFLNWIFLMLKPYRLLGQKYVDVADLLDDPQAMQNFMRMEKWIFDSPDQAGRAFSEFVSGFYQQNLLVRGGLHIGGEEVNLQSLQRPVLNIFAGKDHLVPVDAAKALAGCIGGEDYTELELDCGHIGLYVSRTSQETLPAAISDWLAQRAD